MNTIQKTIQDMFAPQANDVAYTQDEQFVISLICRIDSYKFSHYLGYPTDIKIDGMTSYGETRVSPEDTVVPFGMQILLKKYLTQTITMEDVIAAEEFSVAHFGRKLFARESWEKVVNEYNGKLPLIIRSVPEGTVMNGSQPIYTVTVLDQDLFWMSAGFETLIQRAIWYPTTIATMDYIVKNEIEAFYDKTGADKGLLPFALHDFGGRGVSSPETAEIGGAAHLVNFLGSDTVEGVLAANFYYKEAMSGFSVYATEHAIQCSFGDGEENALRYLRQQLSQAVEGSVVSIVIDGYDMVREATLLCTELKDEILATKAKVVFRPDSGDMFENIRVLLKLQEEAFGYTITEQGYKQIKSVGIIQGDGIDREIISEVLDMVTDELGYAADVVIFGSGGALLQKVNRDTLKFAKKACAILVDGEWVGISKDPITDPGKASKEGVLTLVRDKLTGKLRTKRLDQGPLADNLEDIMELRYYKGDLYNETTFADVRKNVS
jgi:nicotinamide phosphoribosyltransferase